MASGTERAFRRLEAALQGLEVAIGQRLSRSAGAEGLTDEVQMLSADRARLAESLDQSQARAAKLDNVNREVSRRLGVTVEAIREILDSDPEAS